MLSVAVLAIQCGFLVDEAVLEAIVRVESRGNPNALNVNGAMELVRQPRNRDEAVWMARWLKEHGYNFDAGLGQVNSANFAWLGLDVVSVFDPCTNLAAASRVLRECYERAAERWGEGEQAVTAAVSCYNTGTFTNGLWNGYVDAVRAKASRPLVIARPGMDDPSAGVCWGAAEARASGGARRDSKGAPPDVFAEPQSALAVTDRRER